MSRKQQSAPISIQSLNGCHTMNANRRFKNVVFDEADLITNFNHFDQYKAIRESLSPDIRTLLFSACSSRNFKRLKTELNEPLLIETDFANRIPLHIQQTFRRVKSIEREAEIVKAVKLSKVEGGVIVFANHITETFHIS